MDQVLDLSIILTPSLQDKLSETLASITLRCDLLGIEHKGDLLSDPLTQKEREDLRWYLEEYWKWPYEQFLKRGKRVEVLLSEIGRRLFEAVFRSSEARDIIQVWTNHPAAQRQISVVTEIPRVLGLPWELLHDEQSFLALLDHRPVPIIRRFFQEELAALPKSFEPPLRVLLVTAHPENLDLVDPRGIAYGLLDEIQNKVETGTIELEFLRPPTFHALRTRLYALESPPIHVLHFDSHGVFHNEPDMRDESHLTGSQGLFAFENNEGRLDLVKAQDLAPILLDSQVHQVVLTADQSAMSAADNVFSSVAKQLTNVGVDAVVVMSAGMLTTSAARYVKTFYRELAKGTPASMAQELARLTLYEDPRRHFQRRRLDEEGHPVELWDWWVPHFYQRCPLILQPFDAAKKRDKQQPVTSLTSPNHNMPSEPRYGFTGRGYELHLIEHWLMRGKLVMITGFGGVGKTALVREAADWLIRTGMYRGACFVSFEHGGDAPTLLSALGNYLDTFDSHHNPRDYKATLAQLESALKEQRILVIVDNLENILSDGKASLQTTVNQFREVVLALAKMGTGVVLVGRNAPITRDSVALEEKVAHLILSGLRPEDAYTLAARLLESRKLKRIKAPYRQLRALLAQLDYHPLAIQLVLPALRYFPLSKIQADFAALLPAFSDNAETGRNQSLSASLEYSLKPLSEEQQVLLLCLAPFEGGASEDDLLAITKIPTTKWQKMRNVLEQRALLIVEQLHEDIIVPFLHFHPILSPYLRSQRGSEDTALHTRYIQRYYALAAYLYYEDNRHPQPVRALVRRELPNLQRVLKLLLRAGETGKASEMATYIIKFLDSFGLWGERNELRRQMDKTFAVGAIKSEALTRAEYLRESGLGEDEFIKGDLRAALNRLMKLLERIKALPEGTPLGHGSYEHCLTLGSLARCLWASEQPMLAEKRLREALSIIDELIKQQPDNSDTIRQRGTLLTDLGDVLRTQGHYLQAQQAYYEGLIVAEQQGDLRSQAVALGQQGMLALEQRNYTEARSYYKAALDLFHAMGEPVSEAVVWHQLGAIAEKMSEWLEAERCYRESLAINERLGNEAGVARTCNQLALVAVATGSPSEAEGWWKRALEIGEQVYPASPSQATQFNNLAALIVNAVREDRESKSRLAEANGYAKRALKIKEKLDASSEIWTTLHILAEIANQQGQTEAERKYRRREREAFAAFVGNRYHIDRQFGQLIAATAEVANGREYIRPEIEEVLPEYEKNGWHITDAIHRIWTGERNWQHLAENLDAQDALLVLRILESIAESSDIQAAKAEERSLEQLLTIVREASERGDSITLRHTLEDLSPKELQILTAAMNSLQAQQEQEFEPLLQAIAAATNDDAIKQRQLEEVLTDLEKKGWHLKKAIQRIWAGERDEQTLTLELDTQDAILVRRVLAMIE